VDTFVSRQTKTKNQIKKEGPLEPVYLVNGKPTRQGELIHKPSDHNNESNVFQRPRTRLPHPPKRPLRLGREAVIRTPGASVAPRWDLSPQAPWTMV
jgi:hypothetical protein